MGLSVSNFTIENNSGRLVREDIDACLKALQGQSAESSDLATSKCVAGMTFLNTTTNILKIRNSSNGAFTEIGSINEANLGLLSKSGGTMTGVLKIDDSNSAATPALSFDTDPDTGFFRKSANVIGLSVGGTERFFFDQNAVNINNSKSVRFFELTSNGSNHISFKGPDSIASNRTISLPDEDGTLLTSATGLNAANISGVLFALGGTSVSRGDTIRALSGMNQIAPQTNNTYTLGTSSLKWSNVHAVDMTATNDLEVGNDAQIGDLLLVNQTSKHTYGNEFSLTGTGAANQGIAEFYHSGTLESSNLLTLRHQGAEHQNFRHMITFRNNTASTVGAIRSSGHATAYLTSSDYRLKENETAITDGITRLKTLKPYKFNFKNDNTSTKVDGFFAHEVSSAVPEAISHKKDEVDEDGNPIYQGIDQSKLVPLLVAALQEAIVRIETLEGK